MTPTEILREQVMQYVNTADEKTLRMAQAIFEIERGYDLWDELPDMVREDIGEARRQAKEGLGKSTDEVLKKYDEWGMK